MNDCCTTSSGKRAKAVCPRNGKSYPAVSSRTLLHHLRQPWARQIPDQQYYFCDDPACDVVYFGEDNSLFLQDDVRETVGQKSQAVTRPICYCFDINAQDLSSTDAVQQTRSFVLDKTKQHQCDCEIRNPAGRCCLKDFPRN